MNNILKVSDLKKHFKVPSGLLHAVDGVSFSIGEGKTLGVVGESGCGKSTLGRTILHLYESTGGNIEFEGKDITHLRGNRLNELRQKMQIIFQDPYASLNPRMTLSEIISEPLIIHMKLSKSEILKRVKELMSTVGLAGRFAQSYPHELDGGRRQRIGIARALALNPRFIVCDEPVSALDVSIQAQILNLMQDLQAEKNLTYLFITHNLSVVKHISDDIMVMYLGCMVEYCTTDDLFEHRYHPYTKALLSAIPIPDIDIKREKVLLRGEISSPINPGPGCRFAPRCVFVKPVCLEESPVLMDAGNNHFVACHCVKEINNL